MRINIGAAEIVFNGSHTANVFVNGQEVDVFTFAFDKNRASALDFLSATLCYLEA